MPKKSKFTHPMWLFLWVTFLKGAVLPVGKIWKVWKGFLCNCCLWTEAAQPPAECWDTGLSQTDPGHTTHDKPRRKSSSNHEQHPTASFRLPVPILQFRQWVSVPCLVAIFHACLPLCCCFLPASLPKDLFCHHFSYSIFLLYLLTASDVINSVNKDGRHRQRGR